MNTITRILSSVVISVTFLSTVAVADVVQRPAEGVVLPEDGSGFAKVALRFDLAGLREGAGRTVQSAVVDWEIPTMPAEEESKFLVYRLSRAWGPLGPASLDVIAALDNGADDIRSVFPQDHARVGRRVVRIIVTDLAREVLDLNGTSLSILVSSPSVSRLAFSQGLANVHLTIRYGFLGEAAPLFRSGSD